MEQDPDDEFDDLFEQEIPLDQWVQFADINSLPPERLARKKYTRYVVINVTYSQYTVNGVNCNQKTLLLIEPETDASLHAHLREDWLHTIVTSGDIVHIPSIVETKSIVIDNDHHFIIINPDKLISCTSIADTHSCLRKAMLQMKIRQVGDYSEALVHGNIIHAVLQHTLQTGVFQIDAIQERIRVEVFNSLESLYAIDQDEEAVLNSLYPVAEHIAYFGKTFINEHPQPQATPSDKMGVDVGKEMNCQTLSINNVLDIEEHLWSPTYGMKGMIDASIQIKMSPSNRVIAVPFELKTGKSSKFLTHRAQTLLYTLLMSDRYDIDIEAGVLYYSKDNTFYLIPSIHRDIRSLIISRNDLATALSKQNGLPPMIRNLHQCQYCFVNNACMQYHKAKENGTESSSGLFKFFDERTKHLTGKALEFFKHWWDLLDMEEIDFDYARREIWSQPAEWREMSGRCLANMVLDLDQCTIDPTLPVWQYCFVRQKDGKELASYLATGDSIVVSSMDGHINLAMGFVHHSNKERIILNLSEPLRNPPRRGENFDETNNQAFQGFLQFGADAKHFYSQRQTLYRIDKDEISTGMSLLRNNIVELCSESSRPSVNRLRELIIELEPPKFIAPKVKQTAPVVSMNPDQRLALERVLYTQDYCLILGMPGTGKTTTITEIVRVLLERGNSILVTAHTHTALDNVLLKLKSSGIDLLRLGPVSKVMQELRDCFVLVGDQYQLPPIVRDDNAKKSGLDESLFALLAEAHPEAVTYLQYQYRMNKDIMELPNALIYGNRLRCGTLSIADRKIDIPRLNEGLGHIHERSPCPGECWLSRALNPE
ncbi:Dna2-domain-containing protein [Backusella circina FSU 941]|nr:Dna2-domain-containing protein [Backusella circina FSU 941]